MRVIPLAIERTAGDSFVLSQRQLQNHVWKESRGRADWVVVTALDEHLHVPGQPMKAYLQQCRRHGVTCMFALGYQMLSRQMASADELLCQTRTRGAPFDEMSKLSLFNPDAVEETHFEVGRHLAAPTGRIKMPWRDRLLVLHYKHLGYDRAFHREAFLKTGLGPTDLANRWGVQYLRTEPEFKKVWDQFEHRLEDLSHPETRPWKDYPGRNGGTGSTGGGGSDFDHPHKSMSVQGEPLRASYPALRP